MLLLTERNDLEEQRAVLEQDLANVEKRIKRLVAAIENGGDMTSLVAKLRELERRRNEITERLAGLQPVPRLAPAVIADRLLEWRRMLRGSVTQARAVLQRILHGKIIFTPAPLGVTVVDGEPKHTEPYGYKFEARTRYDRLFSGIACQQYPVGAWNKSLDSYPADIRAQFEDYGRLLERATRRLLGEAVTGKQVASPAGFEPAFWP